MHLGRCRRWCFIIFYIFHGWDALGGVEENVDGELLEGGGQPCVDIVGEDLVGDGSLCILLDSFVCIGENVGR